MSPRLALFLRRAGGAVLMVTGLLFVAGPLTLMLVPHHQDPKVMAGAAYQGALGLFILILGLYFLTRRPKKGPENHG